MGEDEKETKQHTLIMDVEEFITIVACGWDNKESHLSPSWTKTFRNLDV